jgi:hypothetical protein
LAGEVEVKLDLFALCDFAKVKIANKEGQSETKGGLGEGLSTRPANVCSADYVISMVKFLELGHTVDGRCVMD